MFKNFRWYSKLNYTKLDFIISYVVSYFISYVKTLMTWENDVWVFDWIWDWFNNLSQTFAKVWDRIAYVIWDAFF